MSKTSFVRIDLSDWLWEYTKLGGIRADPADVMPWFHALSASLGQRDKSLSEFGARLLNEVDAFRGAAAKRQRNSREKRDKNKALKDQNVTVTHSDSQSVTVSHTMSLGKQASSIAHDEALKSDPGHAEGWEPGPEPLPLAEGFGSPISKPFPILGAPSKNKITEKSKSGLQKADFEAARKAYPGIKRGEAVEWANFEKKFKAHAFEIVPLLLQAVNAYASRCNPEFVKHFSTWINGQCWTEETPAQKTSRLGRVALPDDDFLPDAFQVNATGPDYDKPESEFEID